MGSLDKSSKRDDGVWILKWPAPHHCPIPNVALYKKVVIASEHENYTCKSENKSILLLRITHRNTLSRGIDISHVFHQKNQRRQLSHDIRTSAFSMYYRKRRNATKVDMLILLLFKTSLIFNFVLQFSKLSEKRNVRISIVMQIK